MAKTLIPAQRRKQIRDFLEAHQIARSASLVDLLQVSEATVRRDLEWLEMRGFLERTHGGAVLSQRLPLEPEYSQSARSHPEEKRRIGALAASLVAPGETLFVNSGSTTTQVIRHLRGLPGIKIVTNNIRASLEAGEAEGELLLLGGRFRTRAGSVVGRFATECLSQVYASKAFIGVDGISLRYGCTTPVDAEAEVARLMLQRTRGPVIVVADHSKWGVVSNFEIARLDEIETLVTDAGLEASARAELQERGVRVLIAGEGGGSDGRLPRQEESLRRED